MPTWCEFTMKVVAKSEDTLKRFMDILHQEDKEYFTAYVENLEFKGSWLEGRKNSELTCYELWGLIAHNLQSMLDKESEVCKLDNGAHYIDIATLCKRLDMGVEVWARCADMQFQQWYKCNHKGKDDLDSREWYAADEDDEDDYEEGGFDDYGMYVGARDIYGRR